MFKKRNYSHTKKIVYRPEILSHPNIPKPLHGLNPRTVMGKEWWDKTRHAAQSKYNYTCACCGVKKEDAKKHQWLEGHEFWDINYQTGICEVKEIVPLCHYCHNFIHSGRLSSLYAKKQKSLEETKEILNHGISILRKNKLKGFAPTLQFASSLDVDIRNVYSQPLDEYTTKWSDYKMLLEGKLYSSLFKNYEEWYSHYVDI